MFFLKNKAKVAVHNGNFHADDLFSIATLSLYLGYMPKIIRTRDLKIINEADYVVDVGEEYNPSKSKFDHHQNGGAGKRENGIPYAAFGLVWKEFGEKITGLKLSQEIIDKKLTQVIDADDNAFDICKDFTCDARPYTISNYVFLKNSVCEEKDRDQVFGKLVIWALDILKAEISITNRLVNDIDKVEAIYSSTQDKRLIVLDKNYNWDKVLSEHSEPLFVVKPSPDIKAWKVYCVRVKGEAFKCRADLPTSWGSKKDDELAKATGVPDAIYCHHSKYMAIAKSKEGALKLAELAIKNTEK